MTFEPGDYIAFTRIVHAKQDVRHRTDYATGRPVVVPEVPEQVLPQAGQGQVQRIVKAPRKVNGQAYATARVACGKPLGTVTAIIDDAVLIAKQQSLFDMEPSKIDARGAMYGTDAKGHA